MIYKPKFNYDLSKSNPMQRREMENKPETAITGTNIRSHNLCIPSHTHTHTNPQVYTGALNGRKGCSELVEVN